MTNNTTFYRWTKFKNGIGSVALVTLDVEPSSLNANRILEHYSGHGFISQGNFEEVPENGYDSWKISARHSLEYAFSLINTYWTVHINKIEGISTGTNPTIVGYAVLRAFFDKINFELSSQNIEILEEFVLRSWTKPYRVLIPNFFNMTFTEFND